MTSRCVEEEVLLRLLDGELTENDAAGLRAHIGACRVCAARAEGLQRTLRALKAPLHGVDPSGAIDEVMRRLPGAVPAAGVASVPVPRWRFGVAGGALAAALALTAVVLAPTLWPRAASTDGDGFRARGAPMGTSIARAVGVTLYRGVGAREALASETHVRPDDVYALGYDNLLSERVYLLAFGVDAAGVVHWICPAYLDPKSNPEAVPLAPSTMEAPLPSGMQLDAPSPGRMRFFAILGPTPLRVRDVDELPSGELSAAALRARWPKADVRELATVEVEPSP